MGARLKLRDDMTSPEAITAYHTVTLGGCLLFDFRGEIIGCMSVLCPFE